MLQHFYFFDPNTHRALIVALSEKNTVPFSMAIGNEELMHACFPKHSSIRTARMKQDKEIDAVSMESSKAGTKKKSRQLSLPNQNKNSNKHNMVIFYKK